LLNLIFILIVIFVVVFLFIHLFTNLSKQGKLKVFYIFSFIFIAVLAYEIFESENSDKNREVILKFIHKESIYCKGKEINSTNFNFVSGTLTFVGKNSNNKDIIIDVKECK
jgi:hypothetical protein